MTHSLANIVVELVIVAAIIAVLQRARTQPQPDPGGIAWYQSRWKMVWDRVIDRLLRFFRL